MYLFLNQLINSLVTVLEWKKNICFSHVKRFSLLIYLFSFRRPIMYICICVFWQACAFSLSGKSCSLFAFEEPQLMSYSYPLATALQDKASQNHSCGKSGLWLNEIMLKIAVVAYSNCAKTRFQILRVFSFLCAWQRLSYWAQETWRKTLIYSYAKGLKQRGK